MSPSVKLGDMCSYYDERGPLFILSQSYIFPQ